MRIGVMIAVMFLVGCAAQGPASEADRPLRIAQVLPTEDGEVQFSSPASWIPDTVGYNAQFGSQPAFHSGTFVLTQQAMSFVQWSSQQGRYRILWRSPYADIIDCRVDSYGLGRRLVVGLRDFRTHSFEMTGSNGVLIDRDKTQEVLERLKPLLTIPHPTK